MGFFIGKKHTFKRKKNITIENKIFFGLFLVLTNEKGIFSISIKDKKNRSL